MTSAATKILTFEEWLNLPESKQSYEIIDGVMITPPGPTGEHQWDAQEIYARGRSFVLERNLGVFMIAPLDLMIQHAPESPSFGHSGTECPAGGPARVPAESSSQRGPA